MRSATFWDFTQQRFVVCYRCFKTTYLPHLQGAKQPNKKKCPTLGVQLHRKFIESGGLMFLEPFYLRKWWPHVSGAILPQKVVASCFWSHSTSESGGLMFLEPFYLRALHRQSTSFFSFPFWVPHDPLTLFTAMFRENQSPRTSFSTQQCT